MTDKVTVTEADFQIAQAVVNGRKSAIIAAIIIARHAAQAREEVLCSPTILAALELQERVENIQRYSTALEGHEHEGYWATCEPDQDGDWVKYEDLKGPTNAG